MKTLLSKINLVAVIAILPVLSFAQSALPAPHVVNPSHMVAIGGTIMETMPNPLKRPLTGSYAYWRDQFQIAVLAEPLSERDRFIPLMDGHPETALYDEATDTFYVVYTRVR